MIVHVGAELLKSTGGTSKSVSDFELAVPQSIVLALCDDRKLKNEGPYRDSWSYLPTSRSLAGRYYHSLSRKVIERAFELSQHADALFCHMLYRYNANLTSRIASKFSKPYFVVPHGSLDPWVFTYRSQQKKLWLKFFGQSFLEEASSVIFATQGEMSKAQTHADVENGVVVSWPIDIPDPPVEMSSTLRRKYGLPQHKRILVSHGRLHSMKRPLEMVEAFVSSGHKDIALLLIGPEGDVSHVQCENESNAGDKGMVYCMNPRYGEELLEILSACDGYVTWSRRENFNYCLAESLAIGLPVVVSRGNDLSMELEPLDCGWVLEDDSRSSFIEAISAFRGAPDAQLRKMGENGKLFAQTQFSRELFSRKLQQIIRDVA